MSFDLQIELLLRNKFETSPRAFQMGLRVEGTLHLGMIGKSGYQL
jgi:hypothetical protein